MRLSRNAPCPCGSGQKYKRCCLNTRPNPEHSDVTRSSRVVTQEEMCIANEVEHIRSCAINREAHVISYGSLLFFSTETGDAWVLDPGDRFASCLMIQGQPVAVAIEETVTNFQIAWNGQYVIHGQSFIVTDSSGRITAYEGYPVRHILSMKRG